MDKTQKRLITLAEHYETTAFLNGDPSWFMHQVEDTRNQETIALIASSLSYGNRKLFMPRIQYLLDLSDGRPYDWILSGDYQAAIPDDNACFYRLQTHHHIRELLRGIRQMLREHGSIGGYVRIRASTGLEAVDALTRYFRHYDVEHLIPKDSKSCCKRLCMYLRWMVRTDSPVDLGLWTFIDKSTLIMPLDTHVLEEAAKLKLMNSKSATMAAAIRLTEELRKTFKDDPLRGDFALFGHGMEISGR
ncbi:TIGR02757 family protein [Prevotella sp. KH2C16]|uniref:TIGR02757 family protein n=1 Tax=Prevotella sp. KH2C16 TaxID=1855325 RepID=UPI0008E275D6|nr:TIGR02757 family protein [Prevotella sp. KH2C16]SFF94588.1 TIGR02757 family protein [Prevotella sp. KH2C16]